MSGQITKILQDLQRGNARSADQLIPLVYDELRRLAAQKLAQERVGQTLSATALVHEAYVRIVDGQPQQFDGRGHFFAAAAEAMRRILVENARRKHSLKRGGDRAREGIELDALASATPGKPVEDLLALDEALNHLTAEDPAKAELVKLRYFAGLTQAEAARVLNVSETTADRWWAYSKAFLVDHMTRGEKS
jgi:RNA polymerase sigma factor (TIGR02999 family)